MGEGSHWERQENKSTSRISTCTYRIPYMRVRPCARSFLIKHRRLQERRDPGLECQRGYDTKEGEGEGEVIDRGGKSPGWSVAFTSWHCCWSRRTERSYILKQKRNGI
ncbi:hypothetical protein KQX54_004449 [Cotesia glomerata]|uniref:Uncharacterized protein n=1 Tax=Cotesia glomerata TaxID=32391 RepID=A0AAV7HX85_COTGL|nr:hypothetical protein KQX54_004449 [Cotesia glomerata]